MKYAFTLLAAAVGVAVGAAAIVLGEADDSPGLQGLGALLVSVMLVLGIRTWRTRRRGS